jgi:hypothetical protein
MAGEEFEERQRGMTQGDINTMKGCLHLLLVVGLLIVGIISLFHYPVYTLVAAVIIAIIYFGMGGDWPS